jgi:hypothetical protein
MARGDRQAASSGNSVPVHMSGVAVTVMTGSGKRDSITRAGSYAAAATISFPPK